MLIDAIHYRTQNVEERYNVDITDLRKSYNDTYNVIKQSVLAQDYAFDACYGFLTQIFPAHDGGQLHGVHKNPVYKS